MTHAVVIGAGIAGLATAALLAQDGHEVTVLERNEILGGRAGLLRDRGFSFDTGPSWYLMPEVFEHYLSLLGTTPERHWDLRVLDPSYRVFGPPSSTGEPAPAVTVPDRGAAAVFAARKPDGARGLGAYLASAEHARRLAERHFLYNPFTDPRTLVHPEILRALPQLVTLLGTSLWHHITTRFADPVLRQILGYPSIFLAASPRRAPAIYHMMSALDLGDGVRYPMGGFSTLVDTLADLATSAGARIVTGCEVTAITSRPDGRRRRAVTGYRAVHDGEACEGQADLVVSAADLHHTETKLLGARARERGERWWARRTSGPSAVLVSLGVRGSLPELPHHALFFTEAWSREADALLAEAGARTEPGSLYVCKPSETDPGVAPAGHENVFVLVPVPADAAGGRGGRDGAGDAAVERIADAAIAQVSAWAGIPDLAERVVLRHTTGPSDFAERYHSWRGGMLGPAHTLRQSAMFRRRTASRRVRGLYYAGATSSPGVGIPMCLISAELVLKGVRGDRSAGPLQG